MRVGVGKEARSLYYDDANAIYYILMPFLCVVRYKWGNEKGMLLVGVSSGKEG